MEGRRGEHHGGQRQARGQGRRGRVGSGRFQHSPERTERPSSSNVDHRQRTGNNSRHQNTQNWRQPSREGDQQRHNQNNPAAQRNLSRRQQNSEDENEQIRHKYNPFSYHNLKKLATEESDNDVVKILANSDYNLEGFIQGEVRLDFFHFIIKALAKVCQSDFDESKLKILGIVCESTSFLDSFMSKIMQDEKTPQERKELVCNILTISETVAQCMPLTACDKLLNIIQGCKYCCMGLQGKLSLDELTFKRFEDFSVALTEKKSKVLDTNMQLKIESRNERLQKLQPPNDFRTMSAAPTSEDVLCRNDAVFLRPNLVRGKYDSIEHYLDVQFRLLREDFVRPLREGIAAYISGDKKLMQNSSVRLHKDVVFIRSDDKTVNANNPRNKDIEGVLVQFEDPKKKKKKTDWEHTRRFMFGSLLCFSKDNFRTLLISTVSDRDLKNLEKGLLRVVFSKEVEENIYHQKYTMVESEVFFEPYFHVLKTLQSLEESTFPLPEYLIHVQEDDFPPAYLEPKPNTPAVIYNLPVDNQEWPLIVTNNRSWPSPRELRLDNSQWLSLHAALTRELVVIQGPPGTGKTYMGLRIAEILIKNKLQTGRQSPILVVCLTNHALDQFLVDILKFTRKIIRIGGQSKCDELMNYNLRVLKRQTKSRDQMKLMINLKEEIRTLQFEVSEFDSSIAAIKSKAGIVAYEMFCRVGVIPRYFHNIFSNNRSCFNKWLMEDRIENGRNQLEEISQVQYCFLVEEFDKSIESLENKKFAEHSTLNVHELYDIQQQLQADKEWLEGCLNSEEIATKEQCDHWIKNIWKLHIYQKWQLYHYFLRQLEDRFLEEIRIRENEILKKNNELSELQIVDDLEILREADVVGMTTTGAARLHKLLRKLGPEIVIVEEAAEVMESHVVACLTEKCCHLILIGDHKQLRPQVATYELEKKYKFDVSLFERMVNNREKYITLEVQHRMAPEIAQLITPSIYPALKNADKVENYPEITGVPKRLFFIDHSNQEEMVDLDSNNMQAKVFTVSTGPEFSINAPEGGCRQLCRSQLLCTHPCNRVCHVLQRDHVNMKCQSPCLRFCDSNLHLCKKKCYESCGDCMVDVEKTLACGHKVTLQCHVDPNTINCNEIVLKTFKPCNHQAEVKCHIDPRSTCPCDCDHRLPCGHSCIQKCHFNEDHDHLLYVCKKPCGRRNAGCSMNHECGKRCCDECAECIVKVPKKLKCGHDHYVKCSEDIEMIECNENCTRTLICGHKCKRKCKDYCNPCLEKVKKRSTCGHTIVVGCGIIPDRTYCDNKCKLQLPCGHPCTSTCNKPCTAKCLVEMYTVKGACGHQVPLLCWERQQGLYLPYL
ncbi:hypothetical protein B566_EDAN002382 [Ephemera danica]|nr:hypothetical protein B566_EDAN002382 [Ephemera danica]